MTEFFNCFRAAATDNQSVSTPVTVDQVFRTSLRRRPALMQNAYTVRKMVCLVHVVGREEDCFTLGLKVFDHVPQVPPGLRVEAGLGHPGTGPPDR